ncbi:MAG: hypothetical protein AB9844_03015 [Clostridiaceae bacterium]
MSIIGFYNEAEQTADEINMEMSANTRKRRNYTKTISMKKFISEFGLFFSGHMTEKLMNLELRTVLTRAENINVFIIKHVEHTKYPCLRNTDNVLEKEFVFGQLVVIEDSLYFTKDFEVSESCMKCDSIDEVYNSLGKIEHILSTGEKVKKVDDGNIDAFVAGLINCIPEVSDRYLQILKKMTSHVK